MNPSFKIEVGQMWAARTNTPGVVWGLVSKVSRGKNPTVRIVQAVLNETSVLSRAQFVDQYARLTTEQYRALNAIYESAREAGMTQTESRRKVARAVKALEPNQWSKQQPLPLPVQTPIVPDRTKETLKDWDAEKKRLEEELEESSLRRAVEGPTLGDVISDLIEGRGDHEDALFQLRLHSHPFPENWREDVYEIVQDVLRSVEPKKEPESAPFDLKPFQEVFGPIADRQPTSLDDVLGIIRDMMKGGMQMAEWMLSIAKALNLPNGADVFPTLPGEVAHLKKQYAIAIDSLADARTQREELRRQLEEKERRLQDARNEIEVLSKQLEAANARTVQDSQLDERAKGLQEVIHGREMELEGLRRWRRDIMATLHELRSAEGAELINRVGELLKNHVVEVGLRPEDYRGKTWRPTDAEYSAVQRLIDDVLQAIRRLLELDLPREVKKELEEALQRVRSASFETHVARGS